MRSVLQSVLRGSAIVAALGLAFSVTTGCNQQSSQGQQSSATSHQQLSSANFPPPPPGYAGHDMNMGIGTTAATQRPGAAASQPVGVGPQGQTHQDMPPPDIMAKYAHGAPGTGGPQANPGLPPGNHP